MNNFIFETYCPENPVPKAVFNEFFALMEKSFPPSERKGRTYFESLCVNERRYQINTLFCEGRLLAFLTVWEFEDFCFGDHFAVSPESRCGGIGTFFLKKVLEKQSLPFIIEVEPPENSLSERRLNFYLRNGFSKNTFYYELPSMREGLPPCPMLVLSHPGLLSSCKFNKFKVIIYKNVYGIR